MGHLIKCNLEALRNPIKADEMARYMKYRFPFIGISMPNRKLATKELIKNSKSWDVDTLIQEVIGYYQKPEREYHYLAIDLIQANLKRLTLKHWQKNLFPLIDQNAWWDSVDALRKPLGLWLKERPKELEYVVCNFTDSESFWMRRVAITAQLNYKDETNTELLTHSILVNRLSTEFFIQKAIGWALREYSKTNADWVYAFLQKYELMPLSKREAAKYLNS